MKLMQLSSEPEIWINIGTGAVSRLCHTTDPVSRREVATVVMNDGFQARMVGTSLEDLAQALKTQEQDYEKKG